jgi:hypothetical protein
MKAKADDAQFRIIRSKGIESQSSTSAETLAVVCSTVGAEEKERLNGGLGFNDPSSKALYPRYKNITIRSRKSTVERMKFTINNIQ